MVNRHDRRAARARAGLGQKSKSKRAIQCPSCNLWIVMDDARCMMFHTAPICEWFPTVAAQFNLKPSIEPWAEVVLPDGTVMEKGSA